MFYRHLLPGWESIHHSTPVNYIDSLHRKTLLNQVFWLCKNTQMSVCGQYGAVKKGKTPPLSVSPSILVSPHNPVCIYQKHWLRLGKTLSTLYAMNKVLNVHRTL